MLKVYICYLSLFKVKKIPLRYLVEADSWHGKRGVDLDLVLSHKKNITLRIGDVKNRKKSFYKDNYIYVIKKGKTKVIIKLLLDNKIISIHQTSIKKAPQVIEKLFKLKDFA